VAELADDRLNAFSSVGNSVRKAGKRAAQRY
jgi:hypothetical protein